MEWVIWNGTSGERPADGKVFEVKLRDGEIFEDCTNETVLEESWKWIWDDSDITAWRYRG